jgi:hypothetical protein
MAEKKLKNDLDTDYRLLGIATSLKEYKLCYFLNQLLDCDFKKLEALSFEPKDRGRKVEFSVLRAEPEESNNTFTVFTNKNMGEFLLHEVSNFDYIIQVTGKFDDENMKALADGVKEMPEVVMSAEIPLRKIKSKERLVYVEEKQAPARFKNTMRRL